MLRGEGLNGTARSSKDGLTLPQSPVVARLVASQAPVLTWQCDSEGRVGFLSAYWAEYTGVSVERLLESGLREVIHPEDFEQVCEVLRGLSRSGARVVREYRLRRYDGVWRVIQDTAVRVADEAGDVQSWVGVCEDVTERNEFRSLIHFQRVVSSRLAGVRQGPAYLGELLRTICVEGGLDEAILCRVSAGSPTRLRARHSSNGADRSECTCWRATESTWSSTSLPACSRVSVPVVGSYPIPSGGVVTGLLTLGSQRGVDVFLPLLESLQGTVAILGAMLERFDADEMLRASEERYRALLEQSSEGIFTFDPATHRILEANRRFLEITGYARDTVGTLTLEDLIAHDASSIAETVSGVVLGSESFVGERTYRRRDGSAVKVEVSASLVSWAEEHVVLVNIRDVSEARTSAVALAEISHRLRLILDATSDGILGLDSDGRMTFVNKAAAALLGWELGELLGAPSHQCWHHTRPDGTSHPAAECPILTSMQTGIRVSVSDDVFFRKDGTRFPVRYEASPKRQDGRIVGVVVVFRDVSREERLESIAAAVETMNSLGFVFSAVRHELGNPVNSVKMALSVLRKNLDRFDAETVRDFVDRSLLELGRVEELLASLRTYSLYEDVQLRVLDLAGFVRDFVDFVSRDFAARGVSVAAEPQDDPVFAAADPRALRHVLLNLVANAAEAMEAMEAKGGSIRLGVFTEGDWAGIRVGDDGPGMTTDTLGNLFRPFYTTKTKGTGLGLVIAKKMMTKMGGAIDAVSAPETGTTMSLSLRAALPPPPE